MSMKLSKDQYDEFMEEFEDSIDDEGCGKVAICIYDYKDESLKLHSVFEGEWSNYQDEKVLLHNGSKGFIVFEAIVFNSIKEMKGGDCDISTIDPKILELKNKVDFFLTSNEGNIF